MRPLLWGPNFWYCIFCIASKYPEKPDIEYIKNVQSYLQSLKMLLPCTSCKESYKIFSKQDDTNIEDMKHFKNRNNFLRMIYHLREKVNKKVGYDYKISFEYFKSKIDHLKCYDKTTDTNITKLREVPFIPDELLEDVLKYVEKNKDIIKDYDKRTPYKLLSYFKQFLEKPVWKKDNKYFMTWYYRNIECRKIIDKINKHMMDKKQDFIESFYDKEDMQYHILLFYLGCSIIPKNDLITIFKK